MSELAQKVNFNIIRYANCWEDADILLEGLAPVSGSKILSIASAGDNSFALLTAKPELVVAVDVNKTQLHLVELKKAAIKKLNRQEVLQFLGFTTSSNRAEMFQHLKAEISPEAIAFWEANIALIEGGVIYSGKFENYFRMFSAKILPLIHSQKTVANIFTPKTEREQVEFYDETWNTWRWKLLFKIFFSKYVMGKYGRDPEFLREVKVSVSKTIFDQAAIHLKSAGAQQNFMLHFSLIANFGTLLPYYLQPENFDIIKLYIDNLIIKEGYAHHAIDHFGKFNAMNLSNIFEYMNQKTFESTATALVKGTEKNGKLAYWNLMVPRRISQNFNDEVKYEKEQSINLTKKDKGFFYNRFIIDSIK